MVTRLRLTVEVGYGKGVTASDLVDILHGVASDAFWRGSFDLTPGARAQWAESRVEIHEHDRWDYIGVPMLMVSEDENE